MTHDQEEAMTMASRIAIMHEGRIVQMGKPAEIYEAPNCRFVADFIGNVNLFDGNVIEDEADQGYYTDDSLTPEDFETLRENLRIQGNENLKQQAVENSLGVTGQERLL